MSEGRPYVVLHHTGHGAPHYDLMLAVDDVGPLMTWRCPAWPLVDASACEPLPPHRRIYLTYEGSVSNGRGSVRRIAAGVFQLAEDQSSTISIDLDNRRITLPKHDTDNACKADEK